MKIIIKWLKSCACFCLYDNISLPTLTTSNLGLKYRIRRRRMRIAGKWKGTFMTTLARITLPPLPTQMVVDGASNSCIKSSDVQYNDNKISWHSLYSSIFSSSSLSLSLFMTNKLFSCLVSNSDSATTATATAATTATTTKTTTATTS